VSCAPADFHVQIKFKAATYCRSSSLMWYFHLIDELQTDRFLSPEFEITIVYTSLHYQIIQITR